MDDRYERPPPRATRASWIAYALRRKFQTEIILGAWDYSALKLNRDSYGLHMKKRYKEWKREWLRRRLEKSGFVIRKIEADHSGVDEGLPRPKMKKFRRKGLSRRRFLRKCSDRLNSNLPDSERWFWALYEESRLNLPDDKKNEPFCGYIPDVLNKKMKYVIEVHDPGHRLPERERKDEIKKKVWKSHGFAVFVVWAWRHDSFDKFCSLMRYYRTNIYKPD